MKTIAVVGRGRGVRRTVERYAQLDDVAVRAVVPDDDSDAERAVVSSAIPAYATLDEAVASGPLDAVDVCGPGAAALPAVWTALDAGLTVRCDPPLGFESSDLEALDLRPADDRLVVTSPNRYSRLYRQIHAEVENGGIGALGVARIVRTAPYPEQGWNAWYASTEERELAPEDALVSVAAHDFDVLRWTFGPIERTFGRVALGETYDHAHILLQFRNGAKGHLELTWGVSPPTPRVEIECSGDHGRIEFSEADAVAVRSDARGDIDPDGPEDDCYARMCRAFVESVRSDDGDLHVATDRSETTRVAIATRRSFDEGRPVRIDEVTA